MIGSRCGPKHYGAERFTLAKQAYDRIVSRERLRQRARSIIGQLEAVQAEMAALLADPSLGAIEAAGAAIRRASPDMWMRLRAGVLSGEPVRGVVQKRGAAVYANIGRLRGAAIIECSLRTDADALVKAVYDLAQAEPSWTGDTLPQQMIVHVRACQRAAERVLEGQNEARKAPQFFSLSNRQFLNRWATPLRRFLFVDALSDESIRISDSRSQEHALDLAPLTTLKFGRLRACEALRSTATQEEEQ